MEEADLFLLSSSTYLKSLYSSIIRNNYENNKFEPKIFHYSYDFNNKENIDSEPIPKNLTITIEEMAERKYLNLKKWYCLSRPQYSKSCGITSLVSCWNFLFSTLGEGHLPPISQEYACQLLNINPPFSKVDFGKFTGNTTLMQWFSLFNKIFQTKGSSKILFKLHGKDKSIESDPPTILSILKEGLKSRNKSYIYHCYNHYLCILGYESTPSHSFQAFANKNEILEFEEWIILGEVSKLNGGLMMKKWKDIITDINCQFPEYFNIRKIDKGIQLKKGKEFSEGKCLGGNLHCIIEFNRNDA